MNIVFKVIVTHELSCKYIIIPKVAMVIIKLRPFDFSLISTSSFKIIRQFYVKINAKELDPLLFPSGLLGKWNWKVGAKSLQGGGSFFLCLNIHFWNDFNGVGSDLC